MKKEKTLSEKIPKSIIWREDCNACKVNQEIISQIIKYFKQFIKEILDELEKADEEMVSKIGFKTWMEMKIKQKAGEDLI